MILIVAECNVNELNVNEEKDIKFILIVAECNVNRCKKRNVGTIVEF